MYPGQPPHNPDGPPWRRREPVSPDGAILVFPQQMVGEMVAKFVPFKGYGTFLVRFVGFMMNLQAVWRNVVYEIMIDTRFDMYTELLSESLELQKILELLTSLSVPIGNPTHSRESQSEINVFFGFDISKTPHVGENSADNFTQILIP